MSVPASVFDGVYTTQTITPVNPTEPITVIMQAPPDNNALQANKNQLEAETVTVANTPAAQAAQKTVTVQQQAGYK